MTALLAHLLLKKAHRSTFKLNCTKDAVEVCVWMNDAFQDWCLTEGEIDFQCADRIKIVFVV